MSRRTKTRFHQGQELAQGVYFDRSNNNYKIAVWSPADSRLINVTTRKSLEEANQLGTLATDVVAGRVSFQTLNTLGNLALENQER